MPRTKIKRKNVIGQMLCKTRWDLGISQEELAARCQRLGWDIARDTITRIEGMKRLVADYEIFLLATALGVMPSALLPCKVNVREITQQAGERVSQADSP